MTFLQLIYLRSEEAFVIRIVHSDPDCRYVLPIYSCPCSIHMPKSIPFCLGLFFGDRASPCNQGWS